ncbi:MAG: proline/glycine betaine ABC transporter permease [Sediminimonas sp.]|uniref:ABC transporter permease n=1 Tax=Sediminimonas sp. TaxID=2823379 RepID=UPI002870AF6C|nr:proline/glycine betaine ABC transporter permease [Sediminimonas sp.]MDR9484636.1 proline/glycine betaine ABC transporter permease [Sediminimonas sp.]
MWQPSDTFEIPLDTWVESAIKGWLVPNFRDVFQAIQVPITVVLEGLDMALQAIPMPVFAIAVALVAWAVASRGLALFTLISLAIVDLIGVWTQTMTTLAMILTAVLFCAIVGVPLGIAAARRDGFEKGLRPVLDIMQTIPPFVYLVPIVMLFGVGMAPGIIATIIFALPPIIRLTNLGIRSVPEDLIEAAFAFGSSPRQVLWEVQLPLALRTIMAGLNQTLMLALSMAVIAALIGAGGLGLTVYTGLGRLDVGAATEGGLGIVLLAMILDRITQALGSDSPTKTPGFLETLKSFFRFGTPATSPETGRRVS